MATDNYLEKYLPFKIQSMISHSLYTFSEDMDISVRRKYKRYEVEVFDKLHRLVVSDEGIPTLKKRAFEIAGFRKVMTIKDREVVEKALERQKMKLDGEIQTEKLQDNFEPV